MKLSIAKISPPGYDLKIEKITFIVGNLISILFSTNLLNNYYNELSRLYTWSNGERYLIEGIKMLDFKELIGSSFAPFYIFSLLMLFFIINRYLYFKQGSKSIYLMRRLPNKYELYMDCFLVPIIMAIYFIFILFIMLLIYFAIYMNVTPKICLTPNQWSKIWR